MDQLTSISLTSITGVVIATGIVMEVLKRIFSQNTWFGKVPAWCYAVVVSMLLCVLANKVFKDGSGNPLLPGSLQLVLWRACLAAASSSGFYSWLNMTTIADAQPLQAPEPPNIAAQPQIQSKPPAASAFIKKP